MRGVVLIVAAGLALRLLVLRDLADHACFAFPDLAPDAALYHRLASRVARGEVFLPADAGHSSTLWAYVLGLLYRLFGDGPWVARLANVAIGGATIAVVHASSAGLLRSRAAGLLAAGGVALFGPFVFFDTSRLKVSLGIFLAALGVLLLAQERARPGAWRQLALGVVLGLGLDVNRLLLAPVLLLLSVLAVSAVRRRRTGPEVRSPEGSAGLAALGRIAVALLATLGAIGLLAQRGPAAIAAHAAVHLYVGNHPGAWGGYAEVPGLRRSPAGHVRDAQRVAEDASGHALGSRGVALFWAGRAYDFARHDSLEAIRIAGRKLSLLASPYEVPNNESFQYWRRSVPLLGWLPGFGALLPLGLAGACVVVGRRGPPLVLVAAALAYAAGLVLFFVTWRYRAPLALVLWPLAAAFVAEMLGAARRGRTLRVAGLSLLLAGGAALVSVADVPEEVRRSDMRAAITRAAHCESRASGRPRAGKESSPPHRKILQAPASPQCDRSSARRDRWHPFAERFASRRVRRRRGTRFGTSARCTRGSFRASSWTRRSRTAPAR